MRPRGTANREFSPEMTYRYWPAVQNRETVAWELKRHLFCFGKSTGDSEASWGARFTNSQDTHISQSLSAPAKSQM